MWGKDGSPGRRVVMRTHGGGAKGEETEMAIEGWGRVKG